MEPDSTEEGEIQDELIGKNIELGNWDDSLLIYTWDQAIEEYNTRFSIQKDLREFEPITINNRSNRVSKQRYKRYRETEENVDEMEPEVKEIDFQVLVPKQLKNGSIILI
jgi:hypothetical protein